MKKIASERAKTFGSRNYTKNMQKLTNLIHEEGMEAKRNPVG